MLFWPFLKYLGSKWFLQMYDDGVGSQSFLLTNLNHFFLKNSVRFFCSIIRTTTHYATFISHKVNFPLIQHLLLTSFINATLLDSLSVNCKNWTDKNYFTNECLAAVFYCSFIISIYISFVLLSSLSPFIFNRDGTV